MYSHLKPTNTPAQNIRADLKKAFPGVKFSVTSDFNSVNVSWTDGPIQEDVNKLVKKFQSGKFDGIDDSYNLVHTEFSKQFKTARWVFADRSISEAKASLALETVNTKLKAHYTVTDWLNGSLIYDERALSMMRDLLES